LNLVPLTVHANNLADLPSFRAHPLQFSVVFHQSLNGGGGGPPATGNWTTYVGGAVNTDTGRGIAVDSAGNSYVAGWTEGFSQLGFVAKYDASGNQIYLTAFQAQDPDFTYTNTQALAIAVDAAGNAYVTGKATNSFFGESDGYALKLSADGSTILYGTAFGNPPFDASGNGIAVDGSGQATISGSLKTSFVRTNVFAVKVSADGSGLLWQAYYQFPGYTDSAGNAVALNNAATIAFMGGWIIPSAGDKDFFALKVDNATGQPTGTFAAFTTPPNLGDDALNGIAVDNAGNPYVVGTLVVNGTTPEAYFAEIKPDFSDSLYATVFDSTDAGWGIALNQATGEVYGTGSENPDGTADHTFIVKLNPAGVDTDDTELLGDGTDIGYGIGFVPSTGTAYVTGSTTSTTLSTDGTTLTGSRDAFLASFGSFT
jgi:hypothetical protein